MTLVIAGLAFLFTWLMSGRQYTPDITATVFLAFPFAVGIATVQYAFKGIVPIGLLSLHLVVVFLFVLIPPLFDIGPPPVEEPVPVIPEPPFTQWGPSEVVYARSKVGLELNTVVTADRTLRENDVRARLRYEPRRFVAPGETVLSASSSYVPDRSRGERVLESFGADIRDTRYRLEAALDLRSSQPFALSEAVRQWVPPVLWGRWYGVVLITLWSVALVMVWTPARATRWPLLNFVLVFAYLRLIFALPRFMDRLVSLSSVAGRTSAKLQAVRLPLGLFILIAISAIIAWILPSIERRGSPS